MKALLKAAERANLHNLWHNCPVCDNCRGQFWLPSPVAGSPSPRTRTRNQSILSTYACRVRWELWDFFQLLAVGHIKALGVTTIKHLHCMARSYPFKESSVKKYILFIPRWAGGNRLMSASGTPWHNVSCRRRVSHNLSGDREPRKWSNWEVRRAWLSPHPSLSL